MIEMLTTAPRGTSDILPSVTANWQQIESLIRDICLRYNYKEIRTPIFEHTELFLRGIGNTTDIVSKEMYTFDDRGGRSITLRTENTASVVRAYLENKLYADNYLNQLFFHRLKCCFGFLFDQFLKSILLSPKFLDLSLLIIVLI